MVVLTLFERSWQENSVLRLQRTSGNQAIQREPEIGATGIQANSHATVSLVRGHDFSQIPVFSGCPARAAAWGGWEVGDKCVDDKRVFVALVDDKAPQGDKKQDPPEGEQKKTAPSATPKRAGVESFWVDWTKPSDLSPTDPKLRLDFQAKFKNDEKHDPALAEFRQNAFHKLTITAGPHEGVESDTSPLHDDSYSRADDKGGHDIHDIYFLGNDNPGPKELDKDDAISYTFTAEQMVIDTSDNNKVIQRLGPHTAGIRGKHPRKTFGVPKMISFGKV